MGDDTGEDGSGFPHPDHEPHRDGPDPGEHRSEGEAHTAASQEPEAVFCSRCGGTLRPGRDPFHIVYIKAVADPTPPTLELDERGEARDPDAPPGETLQDLLAALEGLSEREMLDQVYRHVTLHLCRRCFSGWIENPAGDD